MKIKGMNDECLTDYSKPAMYIVFPYCTFKCDKDNHCHYCQNSWLAQEPIIEIDSGALIERYLANPITESFVMGGLEPLDSLDDLNEFLNKLRNQYKCDDDVVIYTGYKEEEMTQLEGKNLELWNKIIGYKNIIIKFGRYVPNEAPHLDPILKINLASNNQYAKRYNYDN